MQPVESAPAATKPKHALPQPAPEGPQPKQIRTNVFPKGLGDAPVVTAPQVGAPTPKDPPAGMVPPFEPPQALPVQEQRPPSPFAAAALPQQTAHPDQQTAFDEALRMAKQNKINIARV